MASSGFRGDDDSQRRYAEPAETETAADDADESQRLMNEVLQETLAAVDGVPSGAEACEALRGVARDYAGRSLDLDPVVLGLVRAVLTPRFAGLEPPHWAAMTMRVAETLWEDPASRERLDAIWHRLQQGEVD